MRKRRRYCGTDILKVVNLHANLKIEFKNIFPKKFLENTILYYNKNTQYRRVFISLPYP